MSLNEYKGENQHALGRLPVNANLGKRSSEEQTNASKTYHAKLESLFNIAKSDMEFRLCEIDLKFVLDQRTERKSSFGTRDTKLLACVERKKIRKESEKKR